VAPVLSPFATVALIAVAGAVTYPFEMDTLIALSRGNGDGPAQGCIREGAPDRSAALRLWASHGATAAVREPSG